MKSHFYLAFIRDESHKGQHSVLNTEMPKEVKIQIQ